MNIRNIPDRKTLDRIGKSQQTDSAEYLYYYLTSFYPQLCEDLFDHYERMPDSKKDADVSFAGPNCGKIITTVEGLAAYDGYPQVPQPTESDCKQREKNPAVYKKGVELYVAFCDLRKIHAYISYEDVIKQIRDNKELHEYWFI